MKFPQTSLGPSIELRVENLESGPECLLLPQCQADCDERERKNDVQLKT